MIIMPGFIVVLISSGLILVLLLLLVKCGMLLAKRVEEIDKLKAQQNNDRTRVYVAVRENTALRLIAAKIMPCHYCGVDTISKCPHGFPGCSLADDLWVGEDQLARELQKARAELKLYHAELNHTADTIPGPRQHCHAGRDGECNWKDCPQEANNRANYQNYCPLAAADDAEDEEEA